MFYSPRYAHRTSVRPLRRVDYLAALGARLTEPLPMSVLALLRCA
jgi:hypothetical protein